MNSVASYAQTDATAVLMILLMLNMLLLWLLVLLPMLQLLLLFLLLLTCTCKEGLNALASFGRGAGVRHNRVKLACGLMALHVCPFCENSDHFPAPIPFALPEDWLLHGLLALASSKVQPIVSLAPEGRCKPLARRAAL